MRTMYFFLLCLLVGYADPATAQRKDKAVQDSLRHQQLQNMLALVQSNHFEVNMDRVYPPNGADLTRFNPEGSFTMKDSTAKGKLPYFGRAYSLTYGNSGGIEFDNTITARKIKIVEKKKNAFVHYEFSVPGENDVYRFNISIFPNGSCNFSINSNNRANISYSGRIEALPSKD